MSLLDINNLVPNKVYEPINFEELSNAAEASEADHFSDINENFQETNDQPINPKEMISKWEDEDEEVDQSSGSGRMFASDLNDEVPLMELSMYLMSDWLASAEEPAQEPQVHSTLENDADDVLFEDIRNENLRHFKQSITANKEKVHIVDDEHLTLLHWAGIEGLKEFAQCLLKNGAKMNAQDTYGNTPLHYAVNCCNECMVKYLVKHSANKELKNADGQQPIDMTTNELIKSLLK